MLRKWLILPIAVLAFLVISAFKGVPDEIAQQSGLNPWTAFFLLLLVIVIIAVLMILYAFRTSKSLSEAGLDSDEHTFEVTGNEQVEAETATVAEPEPLMTTTEVQQEAPEVAVVTTPIVEGISSESEVPVDVEKLSLLPLVEAIPVELDDLTQIEGIGPKISSVLQDAGITTFDQLAATDVNRLRQIVLEANLRLADPGSWPEQAKLLAVGDHEGFQSLIARLRGGRKV